MTRQDVAAIQIVTLPDDDARGSHWETMRSPEDALRSFLADFAATLAIAAGDGVQEDYERLEIDPDDSEGENAMETALRAADERPLSLEVAFWSDRHGSSSGALAVVEILMATGGPHVEVVGRFDTQGRCDAVELLQVWSGARRAVSFDTRACAIFGSYVEAFYGFEVG